MSKKRIAYIDILKFLGIALLLFEHTGNWAQLGGIYNPIKVWICSFHMPLFFIAYGMVVRNCSFKVKNLNEVLVFLEKRFVGLIIPYFLWCCIYTSNYGVDFFKGVAYGTNPSLGIAGTNQVLWFLPAIFLATLIYQLLLVLSTKINGRNVIVYWGVSMLLCGGISLLLKKFTPEWGWWFGLDIAFSGCVFMISGRYLRKIVDWLEQRNEKIVVLVAIVLLIIGVKCAWHNEPVESWVTIMACGIYGKNYILFILGACINTLAIALVGGAIAKKDRILAWIGENSLIIMAIHYIIFPYSINICNTYLSEIYWNQHCISNILIPLGNVIITCLVCIPIIFFVNRYMPILKGKR